MSMKRKSEDELIVEVGNNPRKRMRLEEIILRDVSEEEKAISRFTENKITKRRNKLLTAMHLKKRYKYHCKKHNFTYLLESVRQQAKEYSKENRNKLVQNFRSLSVSTVEPRRILQDENAVCSYDTDIDSYEKKEIVLETSDNIEYFKETQSPVHISIEKYTASSIMFEDSDSGSFEKSRLPKKKIIKCLIVSKNPINNDIVFSETEDFIESDFDDEDDSDCDCHYHDDLNNNFCEHEYESSSDDDFDLSNFDVSSFAT